MKKTILYSIILLPIFLLSACHSVKSDAALDYVSDYSPKISRKMPVIQINSESKKNDFVTQPISAAVKEQMLHWMPEVPNPTPWYEKCTISLADGEGELSLENLEAKVKVRENWTTSYDKKPLRIKFDKKQNLLGLNGGKEFKDWVLLATYKDWSQLRDATAFYASKLLSADYTSDFSLVEVYVNSEYWGVYLLAEQQQVKKGRIDIAEAKKDYKGSDIGYLIEFDGYYFSEEENFEIDYLGDILDINGKKISLMLNKGYTIKSDITSPEQKAFIASFMNNLWKLCYEAVYNKKYFEFNEDFTALREAGGIKNSYDCVSRYIDIPSLVNTYILCELACDPDLFWSSFYMDIDFSESGAKKLKFEAPWDFDSALGNKNFCADSKGIYAGAVSWDVNHQKEGTGNPWMMIFINCDWFKKLVRHKWTLAHKQNVSGRVLDFIDAAQLAYSENFRHNTERWNNIGKDKNGAFELCQASVSCKNQAEAQAYLKDWLSKRFEELDRLWL